jgi:tetratricopeptide (TPR) repeat protein
MEKHVVGAMGETWSLSIAERVLVAGRALWFYAGKLFWPRDLTFIYPRWQIDAGAWWQYLFPLAAMAACAALWLWRRQIGRAPLTAVLFFAGTLTPALGFFNVYPQQYSFVADHFQYLASLGLIVLVAAGLTKAFLRCSPALRNSGYAACGALLLLLGAFTWKQGHIYQNIETLWRDTISKNPTAAMAYNNLGEVLFSQGKINEAIECYRKCLAINPDHEKALNNLGSVYIAQGKLDEAIVEIEKALAISPDYAMAHANLANIYLAKNEVDKAISSYKKVLAINPDHPMSHNNLGLAYYNKGMLDEAIAEYQAALAINPDLGQAHYNLSVAYYYKENYRLAIAHCDKAVERGVSVYPQLLELLRPYR